MKDLKKIFKKHKCDPDFGEFGMLENSLEGDLFKHIQQLQQDNERLKEQISNDYYYFKKYNALIEKAKDVYNSHEGNKPIEMNVRSRLIDIFGRDDLLGHEPKGEQLKEEK